MGSQNQSSICEAWTLCSRGCQSTYCRGNVHGVNYQGRDNPKLHSLAVLAVEHARWTATRRYSEMGPQRLGLKPRYWLRISIAPAWLVTMGDNNMCRVVYEISCPDCNSFQGQSHLKVTDFGVSKVLHEGIWKPAKPVKLAKAKVGEVEKKVDTPVTCVCWQLRRLGVFAEVGLKAQISGGFFWNVSFWPKEKYSEYNVGPY